MLLSPSYKTIELSTLVDNKKEYKMSFIIFVQQVLNPKKR